MFAGFDALGFAALGEAPEDRVIGLMQSEASLDWEVVVYAATHELISRPTDAPPNTQYRGTLEKAFRFDRSIIDRRIGEHVTISLGECQLNNYERDYDSLATEHTPRGQRIVLKFGDRSRPLSEWKTMLDGFVSDISGIDRDKITFSLRDAGFQLDVPASPNVYAGPGTVTGAGTLVAGATVVAGNNFTWQTVWTQGYSATSSGWDTYTTKVTIPHAKLSAYVGMPSRIRVTVQGGPQTFIHMYVGHKAGSGDVYDAAAFSQLLFSGIAAGIAPALPGQLTSDELEFSYDGSSGLVVSAYWNGGAGDIAFGLPSGISTSNSASPGSDTAATANDGGLSTASDYALFVHKIELFG